MSPIVISRSTDALISVPALTSEQKNTLWESIVRAYIKKHPEILNEEEPK